MFAIRFAADVRQLLISRASLRRLDSNSTIESICNPLEYVFFASRSGRIGEVDKALYRNLVAITISATSTWTKTLQPLDTRGPRACYLCLRYGPLPMSLVRTGYWLGGERVRHSGYFLSPVVLL